jgi:hypothetical protein
MTSDTVTLWVWMVSEELLAEVVVTSVQELQPQPQLQPQVWGQVDGLELGIKVGTDVGYEVGVVVGLKVGSLFSIELN